jgi:hypothetical protein
MGVLREGAIGSRKVLKDRQSSCQDDDGKKKEETKE